MSLIVFVFVAVARIDGDVDGPGGRGRRGRGCLGVGDEQRRRADNGDRSGGRLDRREGADGVVSKLGSLVGVLATAEQFSEFGRAVSLTGVELDDAVRLVARIWRKRHAGRQGVRASGRQSDGVSVMVECDDASVSRW